MKPTQGNFGNLVILSKSEQKQSTYFYLRKVKKLKHIGNLFLKCLKPNIRLMNIGSSKEKCQNLTGKAAASVEGFRQLSPTFNHPALT